MKSVLRTNNLLSKAQLQKSSMKSLLSSVRSISCCRTNLPSQNVTAISTYLVQKRSIAADSWGAEALLAQGEKLDSVDHKKFIFVDDVYMKGPPPPEVVRICNEILKLNLVEVQIVTNLVTSRLGFTNESLFGGMLAGGNGGGNNAEADVAAEPVKEKDVFDIKLTVVDPKNKIKIIKEVRALTGLGLKEAKDLVEKAPVVIKEGLKKEEVEAIKKILIDAGAQIEIL